MKQVPLGSTGILVSQLCLGTMTWGSHNTESEGHAQMAQALDHVVEGRDGDAYANVAARGRETDIVRAQLPESEMADLIVELRSVTAGVGTFTSKFHHLAELTGRR